MPKKLSPQELAIAKRLREYRDDHLQIPAMRFAAVVGIPRLRLLRLEAGKARLKWHEYEAIGRSYNLSASWLAKGIGDPHETMALPAFEEPVDEHAAFLETYLEAVRKAGASEVDLFDDLFRSAMECMDVAKWLAEMNRRDRDAILTEPEMRTAILAICKDVEALKGMRNAKGEEIFQHFEKEFLKHSPNREYTEPVSRANPNLNSLLSEVRELASKRRGLRAELASFVGVAPKRISEWLSTKEDGRRPDAENALRILQWVRDHRQRH